MKALSLMRKYKIYFKSGDLSLQPRARWSYFSYFHLAEKRWLAGNSTEPQKIELRGHSSSLQDGNNMHFIVPYSQKLLHGIRKLKGCVLLCAHSPRSLQTAQICLERSSLWIQCSPYWPCFGTPSVTKLLKPVFASLRVKRHISTAFFDDSLLIGDGTKVHSQHYQYTDCRTAVRFIVHPKKSVLKPSMRIQYSGVNDSRTYTQKGRKPLKVLHTSAVQKHHYSERNCTNHWQDSGKFCGNQVWAIALLKFGKWQDQSFERRKKKGGGGILTKIWHCHWTVGG